MKTMKKKLAIMAFGVVSLFAVSCAAKKTPALPLDVTYKITSIGDYKITEGQKPDVNFAKDGRFFGTTGCNRYFGQYTLDGQNIKIAENMGMTRMFCHDKDEQERKFTQAFPKVVKYEIKGDKVTFTTSDGMKIEGVKAE